MRRDVSVARNGISVYQHIPVSLSFGNSTPPLNGTTYDRLLFYKILTSSVDILGLRTTKRRPCRVVVMIRRTLTSLP